MWPDTESPFGRSPFLTTLAPPTSMPILPHKEQRACHTKNHQHQGSNTKFRPEELPSGGGSSE